MKIRSITAFAPTGLSVEESASTGGRFLALAREAVKATGIEVQTVRLALPPMAEMVQTTARPRELVDLAIRTEGACQDAGIDYVALGPWRPGDPETHADYRSAVSSPWAIATLWVRLSRSPRVSCSSNPFRLPTAAISWADFPC